MAIESGWPIVGNSVTAERLATERTVRTDLASTSTASFDGTANITPGVTGTLPVPNGGTGATTVTGILKGNGTAAFTAAVAGTDYVIPSGSVATLTTARKIDGTDFNGSAAIRTVTSAAVTPSVYTSGQYYFCNSTSSIATSGLTNGTARVSPWLVTETITISALFISLVTASGDAGGKFRIGIWNNTAGRPGTLVLDAGTISTASGTAAGNYEITGLSTTLTPGLYWVGGANQDSPTTAAALTCVGATSLFTGPLGTSMPTANVAWAGYQFSQTGAFDAGGPPSTPTLSSSCSRIGFKVA
jgi:hypothetical protein